MLYVAWRQRAATHAAFAAIGWPGLLVAACSTLGTVCFITALRVTSVADVTVIYATAPFLAAGIAWIWAREPPRGVTLAAGGIALLGVALTCGGAPAFGNMVGDLLALVMTGSMALMMVAIRRSRQVSMLPASCLSALGCAGLVYPWAHPVGVTGPQMALLALFGTIQFGLACCC